MRTALSAIAIGVQVTMILTLVGVSRGLLDDAAQRARGVGADIMVRPPGSSVIGLSGMPMAEGVLGFVRQQAHVSFATGVGIHSLNGINSITGLDLADFTKLSGGFQFLEGGPFTKSDDVIVDEYYARQNHLKAGDHVTILNRSWRVSGVIQSGKLARVCVQLPVLQDLTGNTRKITLLYVKVDSPENIAGVVDELKSKLKDYPIYPMEEFLSQLSMSNVPALKQFITVIVGLSVIFGFLVVFLSMYTAVLERTREIGILKALGASSGLVLSILVRETTLLALLGALLGIVFSFGTRWIIQTLYPAFLTQYIVPDWWPWTTLIALTGGLLGSTYPGLKAARQDTVEALSYE